MSTTTTTKTIGLISNINQKDKRQLLINRDNIFIYYKKIKLNNITKTDIAVIIASNSFPFFPGDLTLLELEDNPKYAVAVYLNQKYGQNIEWESVEFISPAKIDLEDIESSSSEAEEDEEVEILKEKTILPGFIRESRKVFQTHKKMKFFRNDDDRSELYYDETNANELVRKYLGRCDYIFDFHAIKDPNLINFESIVLKWKELIDKRNNNETSPRITEAMDKLFIKYPFLEKEITNMDDDYLEKGDSSSSDITTANTTNTSSNTNINTKVDVKNVTNKKMIVISSSSDSDE